MNPSFENLDGLIWFNGNLVPWKEGKIHLLTHGLHYGGCVFEGLRVYKGAVFCLRAHSQRFINSAEILGFTLPYTLLEIEGAILHVVDVQKMTEGYIRPLAWRGSEAMGISAENTKINMAIACWNWEEFLSSEKRSQGIRLQTARWVRPLCNKNLGKAKAAGNYMISTLSIQEAKSAGFDDALLLDSRGYVADVTGANLFIVKDQKLYTPIADCFLEGITRSVVRDFARAHGIPSFEKHITPQQLLQADEVFLTGTAYEIQPVQEVDHQPYVVGPMTRLFMQSYHDLVQGNMPERNYHDAYYQA